MRTIKQAIAAIGSLAAAVVMTAGAMSAYAFSTVDLDDRASELKSGTANIIADQVYAEAGEVVSVRVSIKDNPGYAASGITLVYDERLTPEMSGDLPKLTYGSGSQDLSKTVEHNTELHMIGIGTMGQIDCTTDGPIYTVTFTVPANAKENDEYKLTLNIDKFYDVKTYKVPYNSVDGWIRIRKPVTTTTAPVTAPTTTSTTVTTPVTSTTATSVSVTSEEPPVTEPSAPTSSSTTVTTTLTTDISTVSNTSKTDRQDPNQSEPTTASRENGKTETTKKPASSGTTTTATKTGDAGVGVAAAALMLSAATAVVFKRKKH